MTKIFLLFFLLIFFSSFGQKNASANSKLKSKKDSISYLRKCVKFIKQTEQNKLSNNSFSLIDKPFYFEYLNCINEIIVDTTTYTNDDVKLIKNQINTISIKWTKELFVGIKIISNDTLKSIFNNPLKDWKYFNKYFGKGFIKFSVPIFFRNDNYCLFYSDYSCGSLCGEGSLSLYKREKGKWKYVKSYCNWVS